MSDGTDVDLKDVLRGMEQGRERVMHVRCLECAHRRKCPPVWSVFGRVTVSGEVCQRLGLLIYMEGDAVSTDMGAWRYCGGRLYGVMV
jgi:hypothetical protein